MTRATISRLAVTETCAATSAALISAPITVPTLNPAGKRDMIDRSIPCSIAAPSTFMATSHTPNPRPTANRPTATGGGSCS